MSRANLGDPYYLLGVAQKPLKNEDLSFDSYTPENSSELSELVPLPFTSLAINLLEKDQRQLWASDKNAQLFNLGNDAILASSNYTDDKQTLSEAIGVFGHTSPIHKLTKTNYHIVNVPFSTLTSLLAVAPDRDTLMSDVYNIWKNVDSDVKDYTYSVLELDKNQLKPRYQKQNLSEAETNYNNWYDSIKTSSINAIVLPSYTTCVVLFSNKLYSGAQVSLHTFEPIKEQVSEGAFDFHPVLGQGVALAPISHNGSDSYPVALLKVPQHALVDGYYTLRIQWTFPDESRVITELKNTNLKPIKENGSIVYRYDLREYLTVNPFGPLGPMAVVSGDMVSLEEALLNQFPDYLGNIQKYLDNSASQSKGVELIKRARLTCEHAIKATIAGGGTLGSDLWEMYGRKEGDTDEEKSIDWNGVADSIIEAIHNANDPLPPAIRTSLDLHFGGSAQVKKIRDYVESVKAAREIKDYRVKTFDTNTMFTKRLVDLGGAYSILESDYLKPLKFVPTKAELDSTGSLHKTWLPRLLDGVPKYSEIKAFGTIHKTWLPRYSQGVVNDLTDTTTKSFNQLNRLGATFGDVEDFLTKYDKLQQTKLTHSQQKIIFEALAGDYLKKIPALEQSQNVNSVYIDQVYGQLCESLEAVLENSVDDPASKQEAKLHSEGRWLTALDDHHGIGLAFSAFFNESEVDVGRYKRVFDILSDILVKASDFKVIIAGHACQIGTEASNLQLSLQRAEQAKSAFSDQVADKVEIVGRGASEAILNPTFKEIDDKNPSLVVNRRVEIKIYLSEFALCFPASRTASIQLEKARHDWVTTLRDKNKQSDLFRYAIVMQTLQLTLYSSTVGIAAQGLLVLNNDIKPFVQSSHEMLNSLISSWLYSGYDPSVAGEIKEISKLHMSLLSELSEVSVNLEQPNPSIENLTALKSSEQAQQQIVRRYLKRAVAFTGLILLLARMKKGQNASVADIDNFIQTHKVQEYINILILNDDWSLYQGTRNSLASMWISYVRSDFATFAEYQGATSARRRQVDNQYDSFTNNFPVHCQLSVLADIQDEDFDDELLTEHNQSSVREQPEILRDFVRNFNVASNREIRPEDILFHRVLIAEPFNGSKETVKWQTYESWCNQGQSNRLTPFHRVMVQCLVTEPQSDKAATDAVFSHLLSYELDHNRGPVTEVLFTPMTADAFAVTNSSKNKQIDDDIAHVYQNFGVKQITGAQYEFNYWFKNRLIRGIKPVLQESDYSKLGRKIKVWWKRDGIKIPKSDDLFKSYIAQGHLREIQLRLALLDNKQNESAELGVLKYGIQRENTSKVTVVEDGQYKQVTFNEEVLVKNREFLHQVNNKYTAPKVTTIDDVSLFHKRINHTYFAVQLDKGPEEVLFERGSELERFSWTKRDASDVPDKAFRVRVGVFAENINSEAYEKHEFDWQCINVQLPTSLRVGMRKNDAGPTYKGNLIYCGKVSNADGQWSLDSQMALTKNQHILSIANDAALDLNLKRKLIPQRRVGDDIEPEHYVYHHRLYRNKEYHLFVVEFDLSYISPTGRNVKGLRPFGRIARAHGKTKELIFEHLIHQQSDSISYDLSSKVGINLPALEEQEVNLPWLVPPAEPTQLNSEDYQYWHRHGFATDCGATQADIVQHWIEEQSTTRSGLDWHPRCKKIVQTIDNLCEKIDT
ncbi:OmpA family protein [Vibrio sp. WXL103]|uniref:OmpA family protein n=1 Tax=unclassified Vibrio TaxID=2614977 RepID=UPI003EC7DC00